MIGIIIITVTALLCGILLNIATYYLNKPDEKVDIVYQLLPGYNCGACGNSGCKEMARKIVYEGEDPSRCKPLKEEKKQEILGYIKQNGFTLIELLAVLVIVGIIAMLVFTNLSSTLEKSKDRQYDILKTTILHAAETYIDDNEIAELNTIGNAYLLYLSTLKDDIHLSIKDLTDPRDQKNIPDASFVVVTRESNDSYGYEFVNIKDNATVIIPTYAPKYLHVGDTVPSFVATSYKGSVEDNNVTVTHDIPNTNGTITAGGTYTLTMKIGDVTRTKEIIITGDTYLVDIVEEGDFINYDAGSWTQTVAEPTSQGVFGGYTVGQNKSTSVTCLNASEPNQYSGWRVLSKSGSGSTGTVTLVHAGTPECYFHGGTGNSNTSIVNLNNRASSQYVNRTYATSARSINCTDVQAYNSTACSSAPTITNDMIKTGSYYWLAFAITSNNLWHLRYDGLVGGNSGYSFGLRPVVELKPGVRKINGLGTNELPYQIFI